MEEVITVKGKDYKISTLHSLTSEQKNEVIRQITQSCGTCKGSGVLKSDSVMLGVNPTCADVVVGSTKTLTGSTVTGYEGTPPITYSWVVTDPEGVTFDLSGKDTSYLFERTGTHTVVLNVSDSCSPTPKTDSSQCSVSVVLPAPTNPNVVPILMTLSNTNAVSPATIDVTVRYQNNGSSSVTGNLGLLWVNSTQYALSTVSSVAAGGTVDIIKTLSGLGIGSYLIKPEIPDSSFTGACPTTGTLRYGDMNLDGVVDMTDADILANIAAFGGGTLCQAALGDVNRDGVLNIGDAIALNNYVTYGTGKYTGRYVVTLPTQTLTVVAPCAELSCTFSMT